MVKDLVSSLSSHEYINLFLFSLIIGIIYYILTLPLEYYSGYVLEHRFSLSNQTPQRWLKNELKKAGISFIITMPLIFSLYSFLKYAPLYWWLWSALLWFFISIIVAKFFPVIILPLFYKYSPIVDQRLKDRLTELVKSSGFKIEGVYEINLSKDTKKANAALVGLGRQKRIVLCDTLVRNFDHDEIETVVGHELGHHKKRHILKLTFSGGLFTFVIFYLTSIVFYRLHNAIGYPSLASFESLILISAIISVLSIIFLPVQNAYSRKLEQEADKFALKNSANLEVFISTMKKLAVQNLADPVPGKFYEIMLYDHPPISRRIDLAKSESRKK